MHRCAHQEWISSRKDIPRSQKGGWDPIQGFDGRQRGGIKARLGPAPGSYMEIFCHLTKDDSAIGSIERSKAHLGQILHRAGMTFLARSDVRILLQRRSCSNNIFPNCWDSSSSFHVTFGESYEHGARREFKEETGSLGTCRVSWKVLTQCPT